MSEHRTEGTPFWSAALQRSAPLLVVVVIWLLGSWLSLEWLRADNTPPSWDPSVHLSHALYYYAYLTRLPFAEAWRGLGWTSLYYPPLVHTLGALTYVWFDPLEPTVPGLSPADLPVLVNLALSLPLLLSTYYLARRFYGVEAGLLAALLVACYPILSGQSRLFLLDYPLACLTVTAMALLVASEGLTHPVWVWPLGVVAGAALWCKWAFVFIFVPPLVVAFVDGVRQLRSGDDEALTVVRFVFNVVVVLAGMLLLAGPWYLAHPAATVQELRISNQTWMIDDDPGVLSLAGLCYYLRALTAEQIFLPLTLLFVFGALVHHARRHDTEGGPLLTAWLGGGWVVFTLVANKDPRFTMPLLPAVAVLSCSWLAPPPAGRRQTAQWQTIRRVLLGVTVFTALVQQQAVALGLPGLPARLGPSFAPLFSQQAHLTCHPSRQRWPHADLVTTLVQALPAGGKIGVVPNTAHLNWLTLRYLVTWKCLPYLLQTDRVPKVMQAVHTENGRVQPATVATLVADGFDALVTLDGAQGAHAELLDATMRNLAAQRAELEAAYELLADLPLPGGETIHVYARRASANGAGGR